MNVVITGATKGIGLAIAHAFAKEGFNLAVCSRNESDLEAFKAVFEKDYGGIQVLIKKTDVSRKAEVYAFADFIKSKWKKLDVLVNNAGFYTAGEIHDEPEGVLENQIETNLYSAYYLTRKLLPLMLPLQQGHIFNMCSIASIMAYPNSGSYTISKFALQGFSKVLRQELKDKGIKVTGILPGATISNAWTTILPEGEIMPAEDIAIAVISAWKMSPASVVEDIIIRPQFGEL